jgi:hypothetical protein
MRTAAVCMPCWSLHRCQSTAGPILAEGNAQQQEARSKLESIPGHISATKEPEARVVCAQEGETCHGSPGIVEGAVYSIQI